MVLTKAQARRLRKGILRRRQDRARKGKLADLLVSPGIVLRYNKAVLILLTFLKNFGMLPKSLLAVDQSVALFVEACWEEGEAHALCSDALAGLQYHVPVVRRYLHKSWKLLRAWQRAEPPNRAVPFSPPLLLGFAGACVAIKEIEAAAFLLVGFDTMARTGELFNVLARHVSFFKYKNYWRAVIMLEHTKTTPRKNAKEMLVVESHLAVTFLRLAVHGKPPGMPMLTMKPQRMRLLFQHLKSLFGITEQLQLYSLRRGGATWDFLSHGSMERTLLRGRWASSSTARIYLQDAVAAVSLLSLSTQQLARLKYCARNLKI
jgi:hypothetical protein